MFSKAFLSKALNRSKPKIESKPYSPFDNLDISEAFKNRNLKNSGNTHNTSSYEYTVYRSMSEDKQVELDEMNELRRKIDELMAERQRITNG